MFARLLCRLRGGHRIDLFPRDPENVSRLSYTCRCGRAWVSREVRNATLDAKLDAFNRVGAA